MNIALVLGLGFGDESKGKTTDVLCREATGPAVVIRFSGGPQAGHNVVTPDGRHHTFRQFGAGTFAGASTYLSRHMLVNPITLEREAAALYLKGVRDPLELLFVDREALVTSIYHVAANRLAETLRGKDRHGSCGMGIGECIEDSLEYPKMALKIGDLEDKSILRKKLAFSRGLKLSRFADFDLPHDDPDWAAILDPDVEHQVERYHALSQQFPIVDRDWMRHLVGQPGNLVFEGAQGVLLDQDYGFHPHTTWSKTTFENALELLDEAGFDSAQARRIGVTRAYATRHGAGPLPTEDTSGMYAGDRDNVTNEFQEGFRVGAFDAVLARYARRVIGRLDELVVTNLDKVRTERPKMCIAYRLPPGGMVVNNLPVRPQRTTDLRFQQQLTRDLRQAQPIYRELPSRHALVDAIEQVMETSVSWCSTGPSAEAKRRHR